MADRRILNVEKLASGGDGIAFSDGQAVFIPFSIPGESLDCEITEVNRDFLRAEIREIITASPHRIQAPCPLFGNCGGCTLQHIEYSYQLKLKAEIFAESLNRIAKLLNQAFGVEESSPFGYRNRVELHVTSDQGLGFMEHNSDKAIRAPGCPVAATPISDWLKTQNRKSRPARELQARIGAKQRFVVFAQTGQPAVEGLDAKAQATVGDHVFSFPLGHFFQSNCRMAGLLAREATQGIAGTKAVDLYAGAGLFAAHMAGKFTELTLVESDSISLEAARLNIPHSHARFVPTGVEEWVKAEAGRSRKGKAEHIDWIVADPPRSGLSAPIRAWLKNAAIGGMSYVSCDHATMARDLGELCTAGWRIETLTLYDFYPQTGHIEALARLSPPEDQKTGGPDGTKRTL